MVDAERRCRIEIQKMLKGHSEVDVLEKFLELNDAEAKYFYHCALDLLCQSIVRGDCKGFQKYAGFLGEINWSGNKDLIKSYYDGAYPFHNTNILLLASEYQHSRIFELILSNYCHVLEFCVNIIISPTNEDDKGRNAYYYLMRLNNLDMLEELLEEWPFEMQKQELDRALSKAYFLLLAQRVPLTTDTRYFVEYTLNKLRLNQCIFGDMEQQPTSLKQIQARSALLIDTIEGLRSGYENKGQKDNDDILSTLKVIVLNIRVLKHFLRSTYDRLPWEEMEFCLVTFIKHFQSRELSGVYYRAHVNRNNVFKYLKEFGAELKDTMNGLKKSHLSLTIDRKGSFRSPVFKELIETFTKIRNAYSLELIILHLDCVLSDGKSGKSKDFNDILAIERCIQVLGEIMKGTPTTPNMSSGLAASISECLTDRLQGVIRNMRDSFSEEYGLGGRFNTGSTDLYSYEKIMRVKEEFKELRSFVGHILLHDQFELFEDLFFKIITIKSSKDYEHFREVFNNGQIDHPYIYKSKAATSKSCSPSIKSEGMRWGVVKVLGEFKSEALSHNEKLLSPLFEDLERILRNREDMAEQNEEKGYEFVAVACSLINVAGIVETDPGELFTEKRIKSLVEKYGLSMPTKRSEQLSSFEEEQLCFLLDKIINLCLSADVEKLVKLKKYRNKICLLLGIDRNNLNSTRNRGSNFKLPMRNMAQNKKILEEALDSKLEKLRLIFQNYHIENSSGSMKSFIGQFGDSQVFLAVEMLLLDILTIYGSFKTLQPNTGIYDLYFPSLIGRDLRNYLARGNQTVDILDINVKLCILMNCNMFVNYKRPLEINSTKLRNQQSKIDIILHIKHVLDLIRSKSIFFQILKHKALCEDHFISKVDILSRTIEGYTTLHVAAHNSDVDVFKFCLDEMKDGAPLLSDDNALKQNILHVAAFRNNLEVISYLLQERSSTRTLLSDVDQRGNLPLHYASMFGSSRMVNKLLSYEWSAAFAENNSGQRPIHIAILFKNIGIFKVLLRFEKNINERQRLGGCTLMHEAAKSSNHKFLSLLLKVKAEVDMEADNGYTPLHAACYSGRLANVKSLLEKKATLDLEIHETGETPIFYAIKNRHFEIVRMLLDHNANAHVKLIEGGYNILHAAAAAGNPMILEELLRRKLRLPERASTGETILHKAVKYNRVEAVKAILRHRSGLLDAADKAGNTAIDLAVTKNHTEIFKLLLEQGATLKRAKLLQTTLLNGNMDLVTFLIEQRICIPEKHSWKWAVLSGNKEIVEAVFDGCEAKYIKDNTELLSELLCMAIDQHSCSITRYLLKLDADVEFILKKPQMMQVIKNPILIKLEDMSEMKPLLLAILGLKPDIVLMLLEEHIRVGKTTWCFDAVSEYWFLLCGTKDHDVLTSIITLFIEYGNIGAHRSKLVESSIARSCPKVLELLLGPNQAVNSNALIGAVFHGYDEVCKLAVERGRRVDLDKKSSSGITLLHAAAMCGSVKLVELLISKGCNVQATDGSNYTPLEYAAWIGDELIMDTLLRCGVDLRSSLHFAAGADNVGIVQFLLEKGANVNGFDPNGSPILFAIRHGSDQCIKLLLSRDDINVNFVGMNGYTPLHLAAELGNLEVTKILIDKGANTHAVTAADEKPIHIGIVNGRLEIVKFYIEEGYIEPSNMQEDRRGLLYYGAMRNSGEMMKYLLSLNIDINAQKDLTGNTPLHVAAALSSLEQCCLLIDRGAAYDVRNYKGKTPSMMANGEAKRELDSIRFWFNLVQRNAFDVLGFWLGFSQKNIDARDRKGMTALHIAVVKGHDACVEVLLRHPINVNIKNFKLNTALHLAAKMNKVKIVQDLLSAGAIYNSENAGKCTPLDLTTNSRIRSYLSAIDIYFQYLQTNTVKFMELIRSTKNREDQMRLLFGPKNSCNQSMYTFMVINKLTDLQDTIKLLLIERELYEAEKKAKIHFSQREFKQSADILRELKEKYENNYGPTNPLTLEIRSGLLKSLSKIKEYDYCVKENEEIIKEQSKLYGENSEIVLNSRYFSALCLMSLGKNKEALDIFEDVGERLASLFGSSNPRILRTKKLTVQALRGLGRYEEALRVNNDIYHERKSTLAESDLTTILHNSSIVLNGWGKETEATTILEAIRRRLVSCLGPTHRHSVKAMHNIVSNLELQGKYREAINELKSAYEVQKRLLGKRNLETLNTMSRLADVLIKMGRDIQAAEIIKKIFPKMKTILGPEHPTVIELGVQYRRFYPSDEANDQQREHLFDCIKNGRISETLLLLSQNKNLANLVNADGTTPLHMAVANDNLRLFTILKRYEANLLALTNKRTTILHVAVDRCNFDMTKLIVKLVRKYHSDVLYEFLNETTMKTGKTALHVAAENNSYNICIFLLQNGARYNSFTNLNERPVDLATYYRIIQFLDLIQTIFVHVANWGKSIFKMIKNIPIGQVTALRSCRNEIYRTVIQFAPPHKRQQLKKDFVKVLKRSNRKVHLKYRKMYRKNRKTEYKNKKLRCGGFL